MDSAVEEEKRPDLPENCQEWEPKMSPLGRVEAVIGVILCIVFGLLLCANLTIIIQGIFFPWRPPQFFGTTPLVIATSKMSGDREGHMEDGDFLIVSRRGWKTEEDLQVGTAVAFVIPGTRYLDIGRITDLDADRDGTGIVLTMYDNDPEGKASRVGRSYLLGETVLRIPKMGAFLIFLHTPLGMVLFIVLPLVLFLLWQLHFEHRVKKYRRYLAALAEEQEPAESEPYTDP